MPGPQTPTSPPPDPKPCASSRSQVPAATSTSLLVSLWLPPLHPSPHASPPPPSLRYRTHDPPRRHPDALPTWHASLLRHQPAVMPLRHIQDLPLHHPNVHKTHNATPSQRARPAATPT